MNLNTWVIRGSMGGNPHLSPYNLYQHRDELHPGIIDISKLECYLVLNFDKDRGAMGMKLFLDVPQWLRYASMQCPPFNGLAATRGYDLATH